MNRDKRACSGSTALQSVTADGLIYKSSCFLTDSLLFVNQSVFLISDRATEQNVQYQSKVWAHLWGSDVFHHVQDVVTLQGCAFHLSVDWALWPRLTVLIGFLTDKDIPVVGRHDRCRLTSVLRTNSMSIQISYGLWYIDFERYLNMINFIWNIWKSNAEIWCLSVQ